VHRTTTRYFSHSDRCFIRLCEGGIDIWTMDETLVDDLTDIFATIWAEGNVMIKALDLSKDDILPWCRYFSEQAAKDSFNLILYPRNKKNKPIGFFIGHDFARPWKEYISPDPRIAEKMRIRKTVTDPFDDYWEKNFSHKTPLGDVFYGGFSGILKEYEGKNLGGELLIFNVKNLHKLGYGYFLGIWTNPKIIVWVKKNPQWVTILLSKQWEEFKYNGVAHMKGLTDQGAILAYMRSDPSYPPLTPKSKL